MSMFDGFADFLKSPAGLGLLALGTGGAALAAAPAAAGAGALGAAGVGTAGAGALGGVTAAEGAAGASGLLAAAPATTAATAAATGAAAPTGLLGTVNAGLKQYAPLMSAASLGVNTARGLMGPDTPPPTPAPMMQQPMGGPQALSQLASTQRQQFQSGMAQADQERMNRRMQRRGLLG